MPRYRIFAALLLPAALVGVLSLSSAQDTPETLPPLVKQVLKGHEDAVYSVAFSPDSKFVVTGSFDRSVRVWDAQTGKEFKFFGGQQGHQNLVVSVALSPDAAFIASGGTDNQARVWEFPSNQPVKKFAHAEETHTVAVSPDGQRVAGGGKDGTIKVWTTADGKEVLTLKGHTGAITGLGFAGSNQVLVSGGVDRTVRFWNPSNGESLGVISAHAAPVSDVVVHPNSSVAYSAATDGALMFWQLPGTPPRAMPGNQAAISVLALSNDGNQLLTGAADKGLRLFNVGNGQVMRAFEGVPGTIRSVALHPNNQLVAAGTEENQLILWNAGDSKPQVQMLGHAGAIRSLSFDGGNRLLSAGSDGLVKVWNLPIRPGRTLTHPDALVSAALTADGNRLFTGGKDRIVRSWNLGNNQLERQYSGHAGSVTAVAISNNQQVLVSGGDDRTLRFWNQSNGQQQALLGAHDKEVTSLSLSPNNVHVLSSSADGTIKLWQTPASGPRLLTHPEPIQGLALWPDGLHVLTACNDRQVRLWRSDNGQNVRAFAGHTQAVQCVAVSPNAALVAAGGADRTLLVWNANDAKELKRFANLPAAIQAVAFRPDNNLLAAGLADGSVRLFDVAMGKEIRSLAGHAGAISAVQFHPKGELLYSGSLDKTVRVWNVADGAAKGKWDQAGPVFSLALNREGTQLAAGADRSIQVWNTADGKSLATLPLTADCRSLQFNADGSRLLAGLADNSTRLLTSSGSLLESFASDGAVQGVTFLGDGRSLATVGADKTLRVWPVSVLWAQSLPTPIVQALITPRGDRVVSASGKELHVWNAGDGKLIRKLTAHQAEVVGLGITGDANRLATIGADRTVKVWAIYDDKADQPQVTIPLPTNPHRVTFSPNGTRLAVTLGDAKAPGTVQVFDAVSGTPLQTLNDHSARVEALLFHPDNRLLATISADKTARLSDVAVQASFLAHPGGVTSVSFRNNGAEFLSGGADKMIRIRDVNTGKANVTIGPLAEEVTEVSFSRDFGAVAAAVGKEVKVFQVDGKEIMTLVHPARVTHVSYNADRSRLVTGAEDQLARVWDMTTGKVVEAFLQPGPVLVAQHPNNNSAITAGSDKLAVLHTFRFQRRVEASAGAVRGVNVIPNGSHVLTAADDKTVKFWNVGNGNVERTLEGFAGPVRCVTASRNNVLVAAADAGNIRVFSINENRLLTTLRAPAEVQSLSFSQDSQILIAACSEGTVATWNVQYNQGQPLLPTFGRAGLLYRHEGPAFDLSTPNDGALFYSASADKSIRSWKLPNDNPVRAFGHPNIVDALAFSPDGKILATACHDGRVRLFDAQKGNALREIAAHAEPAPPKAIYSLAWSPDSKYLVTASEDETLKMWDAASGAAVRTFRNYKPKEFEKGHQGAVYTVAFSPDGSLLASGGTDRTLKLWRVADGNVVLELSNPAWKAAPGAPPQAHPGTIYGVRFTSDGKQLLSAGQAPPQDGKLSGHIALWNVADGKWLSAQSIPLGPIYSLALAPDGKTLAIGTGRRERPGRATDNPSYLLKMLTP